MIKYLYITVFVICLTLISLSTFAQVGPVRRPPGPPGKPKIPIDGGISLLIAAGGVYGIRKLYLNNKLEKEGEEEIH